MARYSLHSIDPPFHMFYFVNHKLKALSSTGICTRIRKDQRYALSFTTPLYYVMAPTCFGSSLPSSGSFLDPSELLEIQIEWVVYHIMCGYVTCVPEVT
jgi:hypothetical protein